MWLFILSSRDRPNAVKKQPKRTHQTWVRNELDFVRKQVLSTPGTSSFWPGRLKSGPDFKWSINLKWREESVLGRSSLKVLLTTLFVYVNQFKWSDRREHVFLRFGIEDECVCSMLQKRGREINYLWSIGEHLLR